jgi:hypothetical protein
MMPKEPFGDLQRNKQDDQTAEQTTDQHVLSGVFSEARAAIPEPKNDGAYDKAYQPLSSVSLDPRRAAQRRATHDDRRR